MAEWAPRPPVDVTLEIGQGCDFPFHVFTAPQLLLHYNGSVPYETAIRETILLGGENANRGTFIGALLAAAAGSVDAAVPKSWLAKTTQGQQIVALAERLASGTGTGNRASQSIPYLLL
jgi:ADP-ribosylglycohydrolase